MRMEIPVSCSGVDSKILGGGGRDLGGRLKRVFFSTFREEVEILMDVFKDLVGVRDNMTRNK